MLGRCPSRPHALWPPLLQELPPAHGRAILNILSHVSSTTVQQTRSCDVHRVEKRSRDLGSQSCDLRPEGHPGGSSWEIRSRSRLDRQHITYEFPPAFHNLPMSEERRESVAGFCREFERADEQAVEGGGICFRERAVLVRANVVGYEEQHVCVKP